MPLFILNPISEGSIDDDVDRMAVFPVDDRGDGMLAEPMDNVESRRLVRLAPLKIGTEEDGSS